jgi:tetratricopeptide (TPR) repeat protein
MRAFVFTDRSLARHAGRFVWLAIDTEKAKNAALTKRLAVHALPSFFILDPISEAVALRWVGGATPPQLEKILDDGNAAVAAAQRGASSPALIPGGASAEADAALARADRLYGAADYPAADSAFEAALAIAPAGWPQLGRATESLLYALQESGGEARCAALAREAFPGLRHTPSAANLAGSGLECALGLDAGVSGRDSLIAALEADCREVLADTALAIAADDRSGLYISLLDARQDAKDEAGARQVALAWSAYLDGVAGRAPTPEARASLDSHRLSAYLELGEPERAIPMLDASERDAPDDYNPPARLAIAYRAMKRWDDALAASDRALLHAYGPRKLGILQVRADIFNGRGDPATAKRTLREALDLAESFAPGQRSESTIGVLKKKLAAMP